MDLSALYQAALTVIIGVSVYVIGQIIVKFFIEPVDKLSLTIGEVLDALIYYANIYTNPRTDSEPPEMTERRNEGEEQLRQKAVLLTSRAHLVRWYRLASFLRIIPKKEDVERAHSELIYLSNSCFRCDPLMTLESSERAKELLAVKKWSPWRLLILKINGKAILLYFSVFGFSYCIVSRMIRFIEPFLKIVTYRLWFVDLFGFFLPLAISLVLLLNFYRFSESLRRKIAMLFLLFLSVFIAFQARTGQPVGIFNTNVLKCMVIVDSFLALTITYGLHYPPSAPSRRLAVQSLSGAAVSWISTILAELPVFLDWAQQGVLQEKLSYMVLGGKGLFDVLFYWGFLTALCIILSQLLLLLYGILKAINTFKTTRRGE